MRYKNKNVLVTGAAGGMGAEFAYDYAKEGANVIAVDIAEEGLHKLAERAEALEGKIIPYTANLAVREENEKMIDYAVSTLGSLDILINNAGVGGNYEPVGELTDELWDKVFAVDLQAPIFSTRRAVQVMAEQPNGGNIINIASVCAIEGARSGVAYTIAKHGIVGLTKNTAFMYMDQGIRCNAIAPGWIDTGIVANKPEDSVFGRARIQGSSEPHTKIGQPEDISSLVRFITSEEASFINGSVLLADGGLLSY